MTDIKLGANIVCSDGPCGKATNVIVVRATKSVSHIVVENKAFSGESTRMVPIGKVAKATPEQISLNCTKKDVDNMPPFMVTRYIQETASGKVTSVGTDYYFPYSIAGPGNLGEYGTVVNNTGFDSVGEKNISDNETAVTAGMEIRASDGKIGKLDELVVDPTSGEITHLLMREGHIWGKKEVVIPLSAVTSAREGFIRLKISKKEIGELPTVALKR